jgi:Leucine Rich repeat
MSDQKPRKRRLRVTVRVLMMVILILSVGLALTVRRAKRQAAAIARITRLGGIVGYDYNYWEDRGNYPPWPSADPPAPRWLRLGGLIGGSARRGPRVGSPNDDPAAPQWLLKLLGPDYFRRANFVSLAGSHQTPRAIPDLAFLEGLTDVRVLHLDSATFADSELAHARPLKLIRFLAEDSSIGDEGLSRLGDMNEVWEIGLAGSRVTDAGLEYLALMPRLRLVDLRRLKITDTALARLSRVTTLEHLRLAETLVDDGGLVHLVGMGRLKFLDLTGTRVTDAGLVHLKAMPALKWVGLPKAGVTADGAADLQRAIPGLSIDRR